MFRWRAASPYALAGLLTVSGTAHFVIPGPFASIVPDPLPAHFALVYASGLAELLCGAGLVHPRTRQAAGWATAALFVLVFPANAQMALASGGHATGYQVATWLRLPVQVPLIAWAVSIARSGRSESTRGPRSVSPPTAAEGAGGSSGGQR